jgi:hypothetical protein
MSQELYGPTISFFSFLSSLPQSMRENYLVLLFFILILRQITSPYNCGSGFQQYLHVSSV